MTHPVLLKAASELVAKECSMSTEREAALDPLTPEERERLKAAEDEVSEWTISNWH